MNIQLVLQFIFFIFASFISFYLPGFLIIRQFNLRSRGTVVLLSFVLGIVLWAIQGWVFGYLEIRWATYLYQGLAILFYFLFKLNPLENFRIFFLSSFSRYRVAVFLIILGIIIQLIPVAGSGLNTENGIRFFGNNAYDGLTHLGFIQSLKDYFPPREPGAYDIDLKNYHYFSDLVMAELSRVWDLDISLLLFQFMPFLISLLTGVAAYLVVINLGGSKKMANWFIFLMYFAGDDAYIFMLIFHHTFGFYTAAIDNGAMQFLNMSNAMAKLIFVSALIPLHYFINTNKKGWGVLAVFLLACLTGFKIYFGIFSAIGFSLLIAGKLVYFFVKNINKGFVGFLKIYVKKEFFSFILLLLFGIISLAIFLPVNSSSGGLFYAPLEWPKSFLGPGSLDLREWWLRMQVYQAHNNYLAIFAYDLFAVFVALVAIHGTRLLGFFPSINLAKILGWQKILFFVPGLILFHLLGLFTLQVVGGANVFNFFVVSTVVLSLFSAIILGNLSNSKKIYSKIFIIIFVLLTIPRVFNVAFENLKNYETNNDSYLISNDELAALNYVSIYTSKNSIIQSHPKNEKDYKVGYLSIYAKRQTFLSGIVFTETRNQNLDEKKYLLQNIFNSDNEKSFVNMLKNENIDYIYLQKIPEQKLNFEQDESLLKTVYENNSIKIVKPI